MFMLKNTIGSWSLFNREYDRSMYVSGLFGVALIFGLTISCGRLVKCWIVKILS